MLQASYFIILVLALVLQYPSSGSELALTYLKNKQATNKCPISICKCNKKNRSAYCSGHGKNVSKVPELPRFVNTVMLDSDFFPRLNRTVLQPLNKNNITTLSIRSSQLREMSNDTFQDLTYLVSLRLGSNVKLEVTSLKASLSSLRNPDLKLLAFEHMKWNSSHLSVGLFTGLTGRSLKRLRLANNMISDINNGNFLKGLELLNNLDLSSNILRQCFTSLLQLRSLKELHLKRNEIQGCDIQNLPKSLEKLVLTGNELNHVPHFCSVNQSALLPDLQNLQLDNNNIRKLYKTSFMCLPSLTYLSLNYNNIYSFPPNVFSPLERLTDLFMVKMKNRVKHIGENAFSVPSLEKFVFSGNRFHFRHKDEAKRASLRNCTKLRHVELSKNHMPKWPHETQILLSGLEKLETLLLIDVKWRLIPDHFFHMFPNLRKIDLTSNEIKSLNQSLFPKTSKITKVLLGNNKIAHVGPDIFSQELWKSVKIIDLSGNPFACDCKLLWFRDKLKTSNITFQRFPKFYQCLSPPKMKRLPLSQFNLTAEECKVKSELMIILSTTGSFVMFVLVSVLILYKSRWHIRYWIYLLRYKRKDYRRHIDQEFQYDGFIIYSEEDSAFVHEILLNKLEKEQGFKMCVHFRDFEVGKIIVDNIVSCMSESRQAIVVVSKYFCESQWCKFELLLAQDRWLRNESEALVIIMLEEVDSRQMTKDIRALIQTTTYSKWTGNTVGQELFWEQLIAALKKE